MQCLSEENACVLAYWREKAGKRAMPSRRDIDPVVDLRELSRSLFLVDVDEEAKRLRFRVVGTGLGEYLGTDVTGKHLDELVGDERHYAEMKHEFMAAVSSREPVRGVFCLPSNFADHTTRFERLLLPLSHDGCAVNMLLGTLNPPTLDLSDQFSDVHTFDMLEDRSVHAIDVGQSRE